MALIPEAKALIASHDPGTALTLTDVTGAGVNRELSEALKAYVAENKVFVKAGAVVGLNDLKKVIFNALNRITGRNLKAFDDLVEAREWVARQD